MEKPYSRYIAEATNGTSRVVFAVEVKYDPNSARQDGYAEELAEFVLTHHAPGYTLVSCEFSCRAAEDELVPEGFGVHPIH